MFTGFYDHELPIDNFSRGIFRKNRFPWLRAQRKGEKGFFRWFFHSLKTRDKNCFCFSPLFHLVIHYRMMVQESKFLRIKAFMFSWFSVEVKFVWKCLACVTGVKRGRGRGNLGAWGAWSCALIPFPFPFERLPRRLENIKRPVFTTVMKLACYPLRDVFLVYLWKQCDKITALSLFCFMYWHMVFCLLLPTIDEILRSVQLQLPPLRTHVSCLVTPLTGYCHFL